MNIITIDNINYILGDYILNIPIYSKGCKTTRDLIRKKNIDITNYIYVRYIDNNWIKSDGKSFKYDKIVIKENFIKTIPELNNYNIINDSINNVSDIIILNDDEKFKYNDNIFEIEIRGDRQVNNIYFKLTDIINILYLKYSDIKIFIDQYYKYIKNQDYKYFNCENNKKELFLTYKGFLKLLFILCNEETYYFITWTTDKLFNIKKKPKIQKEKIINDILYAYTKVVNDIINNKTKALQCIQLFKLTYFFQFRAK